MNCSEFVFMCSNGEITHDVAFVFLSKTKQNTANTKKTNMQMINFWFEIEEPFTYMQNISFRWMMEFVAFKKKRYTCMLQWKDVRFCVLCQTLELYNFNMWQQSELQIIRKPYIRYRLFYIDRKKSKNLFVTMGFKTV